MSGRAKARRDGDRSKMRRGEGNETSGKNRVNLWVGIKIQKLKFIIQIEFSMQKNVSVI